MLLTSPALPGADLTSLRVCTVGGQTIANATIDAWQAPQTRRPPARRELTGQQSLAG
jgi:hypothetical protein